MCEGFLFFIIQNMAENYEKIVQKHIKKLEALKKNAKTLDMSDDYGDGTNKKIEKIKADCEKCMGDILFITTKENLQEKLQEKLQKAKNIKDQILDTLGK